MWPVFLGAAFAFLFSLAIQLIVVPRVEARKRREERWERDVLTLGELLTAELPSLASKARTDAYVMHMISTDLAEAEDVDSGRRDRVVKDLQEGARESMARYQAVADVRIGWLVDRIVSLDPAAAELRLLEGHWISFDLASKSFSLWDWPDLDFSEDKFNRAWERQKKGLSDLTTAVVKLASLPHPPRRPTRISRWTRRALTSLDDRLTALDTSLEDRLTSLEDRLIAAWRRIRSKLPRRGPTNAAG
jgi:hypothetical protein